MDKKIQPPLFQGGWYHVQHPPPDARRLIEHAEKNTQEWIDSSLCLSGTVDSLNDPEDGTFIVTLCSDDDASDEDSVEEDVDFNLNIEGESDSESESDDRDQKEEDSKLPADAETREDSLWVQCDNKNCRKWRIYHEPWKRKNFVCRLFDGYTCSVICDGCELTPCMCRCLVCHRLMRTEPCDC